LSVRWSRLFPLGATAIPRGGQFRWGAAGCFWWSASAPAGDGDGRYARGTTPVASANTRTPLSARRSRENGLSCLDRDNGVDPADPTACWVRLEHVLPWAGRAVHRRGSDRGSEGIFDGFPAPPSHQAWLAVPGDDRLLVLVVAVAALRRRGGTKNHHEWWWLFTSLILRVCIPPDLAPSATRRLPGF
jgi:hypothetical protein